MNELARCGFVALVGRPNVGKSTLLNHLVGQKIAITSRRPQTTRHRLTGICMVGQNQLLFVDTPGLQKNTKQAMGRYMNRVVSNVLSDVDVVVMVVDRDHWQAEDELVLDQISKAGCHAVLAINKVDLMQEKEALLPFIESKADVETLAAMIPIAALKGYGLPALVQEVAKKLPHSEHLFPADQITDRSNHFFAAELVREKIMRQIGDEIPYQTTVQTEAFRKIDSVLHIKVLVYVEQAGQKAILIGQGGRRIKAIGESARKELERLFQSKVMLRMWIKVRKGWSSQASDLKALGYDEQSRN